MMYSSVCSLSSLIIITTCLTISFISSSRYLLLHNALLSIYLQSLTNLTDFLQRPPLYPFTLNSGQCTILLRLYDAFYSITSTNHLHQLHWANAHHMPVQTHSLHSRGHLHNHGALPFKMSTVSSFDAAVNTALKVLLFFFNTRSIHFVLFYSWQWILIQSTTIVGIILPSSSVQICGHSLPHTIAMAHLLFQP